MPSPEDQVHGDQVHGAPEASSGREDSPTAETEDESAPAERGTPRVRLLASVVVMLLALAMITPSIWQVLTVRLGLDDGSYKFIALQPGNHDLPITYQSCRTIDYLVDDRETIPGGQQLIDEAVARVAAATGLRFVGVGAVSQHRRNGPVAGPIVRITWTDADHERRLAGTTVGVGGSRYRAGGHNRVYFLDGQIQLDAPDLTRMLQQDGPAAVRAIVMHELGHVVGLDHVDDRDELMYRKNIGKTDFGPGDQRGLALLGKGGCATAG